MQADIDNERGQTIVEFALICTVLLCLTAGLVDVGRAFFQYNALSATARYAARWGSVVGGTCIAADSRGSTDDWCTQLSTGSTTSFWSQSGNAPLQTAGASCPTGYSSSFTGYYTASNFTASTATTIVGAVVQRFDSSSSSSNVILGRATPGVDLSQLKVCIQLPWNSGTSSWSALPGDTVDVYLYYPFDSAGSLVHAGRFWLTASSQYQIEGS